MKVLQINSVCGVGSTGRIATDLYKVLEGKGYDCLIAYGRGKAPSDIKTIKIGSNIDNYMHVAKTRLFDKHGMGSTNATIEFIKQVKMYDPDIIHLHNIHGYYINIELLFNYLKEIKKPVVWTLHDCWAFTGHCAYFDHSGCDKWKIQCNKCPQKDSYPQSLLKDNSIYNYKMKKDLFTGVKNMTVITPSKWLGNLLKESFLNKYNIKVINNGIDLNIFTPKDKNIFRTKHSLEDEFVILGVASIWDERKGLKYFLELSKFIDDNSKIVLVGLNDKQSNQLPQNIIAIRRTNSVEELAEIYSSADVFINPTLEDNFPTTNLEALACGTPVITFNTGGSMESVDSSCGIVVEKGNFNKLVYAIKKVKENKKSSYSVFCVARSKALYNKEYIANEYINLYMNLYMNAIDEEIKVSR